MVDAEGFQRIFESAFKSLLLVSRVAFAILEFVKQVVSGERMVWQVNYTGWVCIKMVWNPYHFDTMDAGKAGSGGTSVLGSCLGRQCSLTGGMSGVGVNQFLA